MAEIEYRWMEPNEVVRIADIDRAETIRKGYRVENGRLEPLRVIWDSPAWTSDSDPHHSVDAQIHFCRSHLLKGGRMYGAFAGERLVGIGLVRWNVRPDVAQLAFLHVSNGYRREGIGDHIVQAINRAARESGAGAMYVSATPSESAVGFYLKHGFELAADPIPELLREEPEDIHMLLDLNADA